MRANKTLALLTGLLLTFASLGAVGAQAGSFDGVYNYAYNLKGPNGWETHSVNSGFIVTNGQISSKPSALSGSVDQSGKVHFTGPSPYGSPTATFTGTIKADGTGDGTYTDSNNLVGAWSVTRVSGGSGTDQVFDVLYSILFAFQPIGEMLGFTGSVAAGVGMGAIITPVIILVAAASSIGASRRAARERAKKTVYTRGQYEASSPNAPSGQHGTPPSTIGVPQPPYGYPAGVGVARLGLPERLNLRAKWGSKVKLDWDTPEYDPKQYKLEGYEVSCLAFDGSGTTPNSVMVSRLPSGSHGWEEKFNQTRRWNTEGDIRGYRVDAVLRDLNDGGMGRVVRVGMDAYSPV